MPNCPICAANSSRFGEIAAYVYWRCEECSHVFIDREFEADFGKEFYNSPAYKVVEASWPKSERLNVFRLALAAAERALGRPPQTILDFGAGEEDIKEKSEIAPHVTYFDPYFAHSNLPQSARYDAAISTEVFEHIFNPIEALRTIKSMTDHLIITTLLHDMNFVLDYLNPRGGHVSIFSRQSITVAAARAGWRSHIVFWPDQHHYYYHLLLPL